MEIQKSAVKYDNLDIRDLKAMIASRPFSLVRERIEKELERQRAICERGDSLVEIHRAQGAAAALRTALGLPEQVLREIQKTVE
jgi:hypothetical protein